MTRARRDSNPGPLPSEGNAPSRELLGYKVGSDPILDISRAELRPCAHDHAGSTRRPPQVAATSTLALILGERATRGRRLVCRNTESSGLEGNDLARRSWLTAKGSPRVHELAALFKEIAATIGALSFARHGMG